MQVVEVGDALGVVAGLGVGRDVVDQFIADPDHAPVVERLEVLLSGSQHVRGSLPVSRGALAAPSCSVDRKGVIWATQGWVNVVFAPISSAFTPDEYRRRLLAEEARRRS